MGLDKRKCFRKQGESLTAIVARIRKKKDDIGILRKVKFPAGLRAILPYEASDSIANHGHFAISEDAASSCESGEPMRRGHEP